MPWSLCLKLNFIPHTRKLLSIWGSNCSLLEETAAKGTKQMKMSQYRGKNTTNCRRSSRKGILCHEGAPMPCKIPVTISYTSYIMDSVGGDASEQAKCTLNKIDFWNDHKGLS